MSKKRKVVAQAAVTPNQRLTLVLNRLKEMVAEMDEDEASMMSSDFEEMLQSLACDDCFGTEGQCDPRGDMRNGEWTMYRVEGLDK